MHLERKRTLNACLSSNVLLNFNSKSRKFSLAMLIKQQNFHGVIYISEKFDDLLEFAITSLQ